MHQIPDTSMTFHIGHGYHTNDTTKEYRDMQEKGSTMTKEYHENRSTQWTTPIWYDASLVRC